MMRPLISFLFGLSCFLTAGQAAAQDEPGWYGSLNAGALFPPTHSVRGVDLRGPYSPALTDRVGYHTGWTAAVAGGYASDGGWRGEFEIAAHRAGVASAFGDPRLNIAVLCFVADANCGALGLTGGHTSTTSFLFNALRDIPISPSFTAHVGFGAGVAALRESAIGQARGPPWGAPILNGHRTVFAYQLIAGISRPIGSRLWFDLDYRYFGTARATFEPTRSGTSLPTARFGSHGLTGGLRLRF